MASDGDVRWRSLIHTHTRRLDHTIGALKNMFKSDPRDAGPSLRYLVPGVLVMCRRGCEHPPGIVGIRVSQPHRIRATAACEVTSVL